MKWPDRRQKVDAWHHWFAWHPVTVGMQHVWLEWVERQGTLQGGGTDYYVEFSYRFPTRREKKG